jgi:hypothetical protein
MPVLQAYDILTEHGARTRIYVNNVAYGTSFVNIFRILLQKSEYIILTHPLLTSCIDFTVAF